MLMGPMHPPPGAVPVAVAQARYEPIEGSVTYTGTVQSYEDEDIYPRLTGTIVEMPVYPGDRVHQGQLLVVLDNQRDSEYFQRLEEARYASIAAQHEAGVFKEEFTEKRFQLDAAMDAEQAAQEEMAQARAKLDYWLPELEREATLLKTQVVSRQEYDNELSELKVAQAALRQAEARLGQAQSSRRAAQAAFDAAVHHVGHGRADADKAQAAAEVASTINRYTRILAGKDGIVTRRLISPGVLVNPGMMILKVAHINQVRLQAEVASSDLDQIRIGAPVSVISQEGKEASLSARVTAIFPAADPSSRTSIVEALVDNRTARGAPPGDQSGSKAGVKGQDSVSAGSYRFLPGQYVVMSISTGRTERALTIPTSALIWREGKAQVWRAIGSTGQSHPQQYSCPMHPQVVSERPGRCPKCGAELQPRQPGGAKAVELVDVRVGLSNSERSEVLSGLAAGDQVVYGGYADLQPGSMVVAAEWGKPGPVKLPRAADLADNQLRSGNNWSLASRSGNLLVSISLSPVPPVGSRNSVLVRLSRPDSLPVAGARITAQTSMPTMNMAGPSLLAEERRPGSYELKSNLMSGTWQLNLSIAPAGDKPCDLTFSLEIP